MAHPFTPLEILLARKLANPRKVFPLPQLSPVHGVAQASSAHRPDPARDMIHRGTPDRFTAAWRGQAENVAASGAPSTCHLVAPHYRRCRRELCRCPGRVHGHSAAHSAPGRQTAIREQPPAPGKCYHWEIVNLSATAAQSQRSGKSIPPQYARD